MEQRLAYHILKEFPNSFTAKYPDWEIYYEIPNLTVSIAKKMEFHLKKMKSRKYFMNLKKYPEITEKLLIKFS